MTPTLSQIKTASAAHYGVSRADLEGDSRLQQFVRPRHVAWFVSRELTRKSFSEIGRQYGGRDHTTVMSGIRSIRKRMDSDLSSEIASVKALAADLANIQSGGVFKSSRSQPPQFIRAGEIDRLRGALIDIEFLTATGDGLTPEQAITVHLLAAEGRADDPAAWRFDERVVKHVHELVSANIKSILAEAGQ